VVDHLASGPGHAVTTRWQIVAPNQVAYEVTGGGGAIIIGGSRWDRAPGGSWRQSPQDPPLRQPVPYWQRVTDAHVLGQGTERGTPVWRVSFFDPVTLAWFEVGLAKSTTRTLELKMFTTAHFMHDFYGSFNRKNELVRPR
jgi:hypothetical protein